MDKDTKNNPPDKSPRGQFRGRHDARVREEPGLTIKRFSPYRCGWGWDAASSTTSPDNHQAGRDFRNGRDEAADGIPVGGSEAAPSEQRFHGTLPFGYALRWREMVEEIKDSALLRRRAGAVAAVPCG
jgi:hypothetical protein